MYLAICSGEESSSVRRLVGSSSGTQESTAAAKGSGITEQSGKILTCNVFVLLIICVFLNKILYFFSIFIIFIT